MIAALMDVAFSILSNSFISRSFYVGHNLNTSVIEGAGGLAEFGFYPLVYFLSRVYCFPLH